MCLVLSWKEGLRLLRLVLVGKEGPRRVRGVRLCREESARSQAVRVLEGRICLVIDNELPGGKVPPGLLAGLVPGKFLRGSQEGRFRLIISFVCFRFDKESFLIRRRCLRLPGVKVFCGGFC